MENSFSSPKISIIIPIYGVERYLNRCIDSVLNQTYYNLEVILVDDGSPDNCPQICDEYSRKDSRIKVIHKKNAGLGFARNSGLDIATGEYIAFVDADDYIATNMYEVLYDESDNGRVDAVFSSTIFYDLNNRCRIRMDVERRVEFSGKEEIDSFLLDYVAPNPESNTDVKYMTSVWRAIYKRKVIEDNYIRFVSERQYLSEDIPFNIDFISSSSRIVYLPDAFYYYCSNDVSLSNTNPIDKIDKLPEYFRLIECKLKNLYIQEKYILHFYRMILLYLRNAIICDYISCKKEKLKWKVQFRKRISESYYVEVMAKYPFRRMPFKFQVFNYFLKSRNAVLVYLLLRISQFTIGRKK